VPPYTYQWYDATDMLISTSESSGSIPTGIYRVVVTDAQSNQTEITNIELSQPNLLEITTINITALGCYNATDASIEITVAGGTGDYTYQWSTLGHNSQYMILLM